VVVVFCICCICWCGFGWAIEVSFVFLVLCGVALCVFGSSFLYWWIVGFCLR